MLSYEVISDIDQAHAFWDHFSSNAVLEDTWEYRFCMYKYFMYPLHFVLGKHGNEPVCLLPFQLNTDQGYIEFFGGSYMKQNRLFFKPGYENAVKECIQTIKQPLYLEWMSEEMDFLDNLEIQKNAYYLDLKTMRNYNDYIETFLQGKTKKNITKQIQKLHEKHQISVIYDCLEDFDRMVELNIQRFGERSTFHLPHRVSFYRDLLEQYDVHMLTLQIDGKKESIGMSIKYKNIYVGMTVGTNIEISNLGKLLVLERMNQAVQLGCTCYDVGRGLPWKDIFQFAKKPLYKFTTQHGNIT